LLCSCLEEGFLDSARNDGSFFVFLVCSCFGGGISRLCSKWRFFFRFFGLFLFWRRDFSTLLEMTVLFSFFWFVLVWRRDFSTLLEMTVLFSFFGFVLVWRRDFSISHGGLRGTVEMTRVCSCFGGGILYRSWNFESLYFFLPMEILRFTQNDGYFFNTKTSCFIFTFSLRSSLESQRNISNQYLSPISLYFCSEW